LANFIAPILLVVGSWLPFAANASVALPLQGEFLAAELVQVEKETHLAVFTRVGEGDQSTAQLEWFDLAEDAPVRKKVHALWRDTVGYDLCRFGKGDDSTQLLFIRPDGVYRLDSSQALVRKDLVFAHRHAERLPRIPICFEFDSAGRSEFLLPTLRGVELWAQGEKAGEFRERASLPLTGRLNFFARNLDVSAENPHQKVQFSLEFPAVFLQDFNGNGRRDICLAMKDELVCYFRSEAGGFPVKDRREYEFSLKEKDEGNTVRYLTHLVDINNDGRLDVLINRHEYNLTNMQGKLAIFSQNDKGGFAQEPNQVIERSGFFGSQGFIDLNGNGYLDIVAPAVNLGWTALAGIFLRRTANIDFLAWPNEKGSFAKNETTLHRLSYPVDFRNFASVFGAFPIWQSDFVDNEPRHQVMFFPDGAAVEIFAFEKESFSLSPRLWRKRADLGSVIKVLPLQGGKSKALLTAYPAVPEKGKRLVILPR